MARFAYALVLPDMRESLGWSYSAAGFLNTVNAIGYLAGALMTAEFIRRAGLFRATWIGALVCTLSLGICALSGNFIVLSGARLLSGFAAAATFVGGGALAALVAQSRPAQSALLLALFYTGPGTGLISDHSRFCCSIRRGHGDCLRDLRADDGAARPQPYRC